MKPTKILSLAILSLLIISIPKTLISQIKKGNWLVEGNLGNISILNNKNESTSGVNTSKSENQGYYISLYPRIGYFLNNNLVLGTTLNFSYRSSKNILNWTNGMKAFEGVSNGGSIGLSPFLRYYFTKSSKNRFYGQLGGGMDIDIFQNYEANTYNERGEKSESYKNPSNGHDISGEALIGFNHFFTDHVAFNSSLGYNYSQRTQTTIYSSIYNGRTTTSPESKSISTTGNVIWNFGFTIIISGKKAK